MTRFGPEGGRGREPGSPFSISPTVAEGRLSLPDGGAIAETVLDNGVQVLTESIPGVRSASAGIWVRHGSAHEHPSEMGISHLLEHMVFKGTETRSARDIALALEGLGGSLDAYTTREYTSFQARVLDEHLPDALEVLADMTLRPVLREEDLELERQVVLEEIAMVADTPDDLVFDLHGARFWNGHPYGHSILGSRETVAGFSTDDLREAHARAYRGQNLVVGAAGHVEHDGVVEQVAELLGGLPQGDRVTPIPPPLGSRVGHERVDRPGSQSHVVFGASAVPHTDPRRYAIVLLSTALGGGMSSRLFQRVREELGLAYAVYAFHSFYGRGGLTGVYVGTRPEWEDRAVETILGAYRRLADEGLPTDELDQTRRQVKGQIMLALESTGARLHRLASYALYDEPYRGLDEVLARIDGVTSEGIAEAAADFFDPGGTFVLRLGPGRRSP